MAKLDNRGFTLTEMMLVIGIIVILTAVAAPVYQSLSNTNELDSATSILAQYLYQAQSFSRNQTQDSQWGVAINGQIITLFSGATYATRTTDNDITYKAPTTVHFSGLNQIVYSKLYGLPMTTGTFTGTSSGKTSSVTVNGKGMVEY